MNHDDYIGSKVYKESEVRTSLTKILKFHL